MQILSQPCYLDSSKFGFGELTIEKAQAEFSNHTGAEILGINSMLEWITNTINALRCWGIALLQCLLVGLCQESVP